MEARVETTGERRRGGHGPERSCVACRRKDDARKLLRVVRAPDGSLVIDWRRNLGGRGAHVCAARACIESAIRKRSFDRALKARLRYPQPQALIDLLRQAMTRQIETLVGSAARSGKLCAGTDAVRRALAGGEASCVLLAGDAASRERLAAAAEAAGVAHRALTDKIELGALVGRGETGVLAITDRGLAAAIVQAISRKEALGGESPGDGK